MKSPPPPINLLRHSNVSENGTIKDTHFWLFACNRTKLGQRGGQEGGEEEGGAQEVEDVQRQLFAQHMLQEPNGHLQESGGEVDTLICTTFWGPDPADLWVSQWEGLKGHLFE